MEGRLAPDRQDFVKNKEMHMEHSSNPKVAKGRHFGLET